MLRYLCICVIACDLFVIAAPQAFSATQDERTLEKGMSSDVIDYIDRKVSCNYWSSEPSYDAERRTEIEKNLEELRCDVIDQNERELRNRFQKDPKVLKAITTSRDMMPD